MKTKHLISIAAAMLFTLASLATQAQDVYEYVTLQYLETTTKIYVSYSNGNHEELETERVKGPCNITPVLTIMSKMSEQGWEIVNQSSDSLRWRFLLKRKVK